MQYQYTTPWFDPSLTEAEAVQALSAKLDKLANDQGERQFRLLRNISMYLNQDVVTGDTYRPAMPPRIINRTKAVLDTLVSRQIQDEVRAVFDCDDGDYEQHKRAADMERFVSGETYRMKLREKFRLSLRDSGICGDGWLYFTARAGKVAAERVSPLEMYLDLDGSMSTAREIYRRQYMPRSRALGLFPEHRSLILDLPTEAIPYYWSSTDSDLVRIDMGWHLPEEGSEKGGLFVMGMGQILLAHEEWKSLDFPFVRIPWDPSVVEGYSMSLVDYVMPLELELDMVTRRIQASVRLFAVPRVLQQAGTTVSPEYNNRLGNVYKYTGMKPEFDSGTPPPPGLYERERQLLDLIDAQAGVSAMELTGDVPSHTDSRPALREVQEIAAGRRAWLSKICAEALAIKCSEQIIRVARDIVKDRKTYSAFGRAKDFVGQIDFADCDLDDDRFQLRVQDANLLPETRAGKRLAATDLAKTNIFQPNELAEMLAGAPDVSAILTRKNAPMKLVEKQVYSITAKQKYLAPDENQDTLYAKKYALDEYQLLLAKENVPDEVFNLLNRYIFDCDQIEEMKNPPPEMAAPPGPMAPGAPMPGMPMPMGQPMPPGYAPAPGGPPVMSPQPM